MYQTFDVMGKKFFMATKQGSATFLLLEWLFVRDDGNNKYAALF
jgi:hypothetical protein